MACVKWPEEERYRPSGRGAVHDREKYFWRRLAVLLLVAGLGAVIWSGAQKLAAGAAVKPGPAVSCPRGEVAVPAAAQALGEVSGTCGAPFIARPGDTVWSVAVRYAGAGDPRPLEDTLQAEVLGGVLQPGERLVVPR